MGQRYAFLLRTVDSPVLVLGDNLDRCHADYVVDLLEGLQTLLRHPEADGSELNFVAFIIAADRDWLCHSFLQKYRDCESTARRPGRMFGQGFLEQVLDLEARLPSIPAALTLSARDCAALSEDEQADIAQQFRALGTERAVRELVRSAESSQVQPGRAAQPRQVYRIEP